jgi:cytochrome P450
MRISTPPAGARVPLDEINLADVDLYTSGDPHLVWQTLRAERPVFWQERPDGEGFWAVTRQAEVRRVLAEYETFTSEKGTAISMLDAPDPSAGRMMQATDPPRHRQFRHQIGKPFSAHALTALSDEIRLFVKSALSQAEHDQVWDAAESFTRLPMAVAALMMGLPDKDIDPLMHLAFASLAPHDQRFGSGPEKATAAFAHYDIIEYFIPQVEKRRESPSTDLISHLLSVEIDGRPLTEEEVLLNCLSLLLGAVVTTSQAISALLIALAEHNGGEGHWPHGMPIRTAVEEVLRWSSPVTHFMRRARRDVEMHGEKIRAGDAVTAWIASANRDEDVFGQPYVLDFKRAPNQHVAFGHGSHRCLGNNLARLMIQESFEQLAAHIESFELAGTPCHLASVEIAGVVSLPIRARLRTSTRKGSI